MGLAEKHEVFEEVDIGAAGSGVYLSFRGNIEDTKKGKACLPL